MSRGRSLTRPRRLVPASAAPTRRRTSLVELARLILPLGLLLTTAPAPLPRPVPALEVVFAGCDVIRTPEGRVVCKVTGASIFDGAARGRLREGEARTLTIKATASPGARVWAAVDGNLVRPLPRRSDERIVVPIYKGAGELTVTADLGGQIRVFRLPLWSEELPDQERLDEAMRLRKQGTADAQQRARALLDELVQSPTPAVRAKATGQAARMIVHRDLDAGLARLREAMDLDRAAGLIADEIADGFVLTARLIDDKRDVAAASAVLDRIDPLAADFPVGRAMLPMYRAQVFTAWGDLGTAAKLLRSSAERSEALDLAGHLADVYQDQLAALDDLGRGGEADRAAELLARLDTRPGDTCAVMQREVNLALHAVRVGATASAVPRLERALELSSERTSAVAEARCPDASERWRVLTVLAQVAVDTGRFEDAAAILQRAEAEVQGEPGDRLAEGRLLRGRIDLARRRPEAALGAFEDAVKLARAVNVPELEVAAEVARAEALERLDRPEEAERAWDAADARLDRWSARIPLGDGKNSFLGRRDGVVRRYLELLLRRAEVAPAEAARWTAHAGCVARRSRARVLSFAEHGYRMASSPTQRAALSDALLRFTRARDALDQEAARIFAAHEGQPREVRLLDLQGRGSEIAGALDRAVADVAGQPARSCKLGEASGLSEPAAGEAILVYHPAEDGWVGFALAAGSAPVVRRVRVDPDDGVDIVPADREARARRQAALAGRLLEPFAAALAGKTRVRIIAAEPLGAIDFHDLPLGGQRLGARFSVSYGVDLPRRAAPTTAGAQRVRRALIVAPDSDLPMTVVEAGNVRRALEKAGFDVVMLTGGDATLEAVRRGLVEPGLEIFHYAGHSVAEGRDGWESRLALARGGWLGLADVMTLARVPRVVTLSSCEAAGASREAYVEGIALAQAFVIAGAEVAVAGAHRNDDAFTSKIMAALYGGSLPDFLADPARALRAATEAVRLRPEMAAVEELPALRVLIR